MIKKQQEEEQVRAFLQSNEEGQVVE